MTSTATVQEILNAATGELGLPAVQYGATAYDQTGQQMIALLSSVGENLSRVHDWQFLEKTHTFSGDGVTSEFPLPTDFGRQVNQTQWSTRDQRPMTGPVTAQVWGWCKYGIVSAGFYYRYRILGNKLNVFPTPPAGSEFAFFYISKNWIMDTSGALKSSVSQSSDIPLFDKRLMVTGLKSALWGQKGFDTTQIQAEFNYVLENEKSYSQGAAALSLTNWGGDILLNERNVADGSWEV